MSKKTISLNMGPQHPSTHGVLRLKLELDGEIVKDLEPVIGYLHTGIEKNTEKHLWQQVVTDVTRMDYVSNISHEAAYCLAVEKLLKIDEKVPKRANVIRVLFLELSRIASHLMAIGTGGNDLGGTSLMTMSFQAREQIMLFFESVSGLRMNNEYFRIGGVSNNVDKAQLEELGKNIKLITRGIKELDYLLSGNPIWKARSKGVGYLSLDDCIKYGVTGPVLRSAGVNKDLRKSNPYFDYDTYNFEIPYCDSADSWGRYLIRMEEMKQSLKIVEEAMKRLKYANNDEYIIDDVRIAPTSKLSVDNDGLGQEHKNVEKLGYGYKDVQKKDGDEYSSSGDMEHLINHFKYVTEGFSVPKGVSFASVECARGIVDATVVSDGKNKPYRVHFTDASFTNLQALKKMCVGGYLSDIVVSLASLDPVLGSVDR